MNEPGLSLSRPHAQRYLQIALGGFWALDAALQYQPFMFGKGFVAMISATADGQPLPVAWSINAATKFILPDIAVWNFLFATVQLAIGVGLCVRRTVRPALALMFAWVVVVWWLGEGLGSVFSGSASPLTGAPGSVLLYGGLGLLCWPRRTPPPRAPERPQMGPDRPQMGPDRPQIGIASSLAAQGPLGVAGALGVWAAYWTFSALLWLFPVERGGNSIATALSGAASGEPGWYAHFLGRLAGALSGTGASGAWVLAALSLAIGLGPVFIRRPSGFLLFGAGLSIAYFATGQALGGIMTGMATDPGTSPLVVLLAAALVPRRAAARGERAPASAMAKSHPVGVSALTSLAVASLLLAGTYPVPGPLPGSDGMPMPSRPGTGSSPPMGGMRPTGAMDVRRGRSAGGQGDMEPGGQDDMAPGGQGIAVRPKG